jgi:hypothetical protein
MKRNVKTIMKKHRYTVVVVAAICFGLLNLACPTDKHEEKMEPIGPGVRADLLIYFKTEATEAETNLFYKDVLSRPSPDGRGYSNPPGVRTVLRLSEVQDHEGVAVTFFPAATKDERENLKQSVHSSSLVYKVLENRSPADVRRLD